MLHCHAEVGTGHHLSRRARLQVSLPVDAYALSTPLRNRIRQVLTAAGWATAAT